MIWFWFALVFELDFLDFWYSFGPLAIIRYKNVMLYLQNNLLIVAIVFI